RLGIRGLGLGGMRLSGGWARLALFGGVLRLGVAAAVARSVAAPLFPRAGAPLAMVRGGMVVVL
ncbi:hypothetical protein LWX53_10675, partial [bacterium]|nr:hypothetical protein [bacterium]